MERLQKFLSSCGVASRRKSEELIKEGKIKVNDKIITDMGFKVSDKDKVYVNNILVERQDKIYYLLYIIKTQ